MQQDINPRTRSKAKLDILYDWLSCKKRFLLKVMAQVEVNEVTKRGEMEGKKLTSYSSYSLQEPYRIARTSLRMCTPEYYPLKWLHEFTSSVFLNSFWYCGFLVVVSTKWWKLCISSAHTRRSNQLICERLQT